MCPENPAAEVISFLGCSVLLFSILLNNNLVNLLSSFQTLLLPLNLLFPATEIDFNTPALCDASRLQSEDFISEITPNLLLQRQVLQNTGNGNDTALSILPFRCNPCEFP